MDLILWRHAEAEEGFPDLARQLTHTGHEQARRMSRWLRERLPNSATILCSPAERCQQTAEALTDRFTTVPELAPGTSVRSLLQVAGWPRFNGCVLLVSHQPTLGELASYLLSGAALPWNVRRGAVWWISSRNRERHLQAVLKAAISPDMV